MGVVTRLVLLALQLFLAISAPNDSTLNPLCFLAPWRSLAAWRLIRLRLIP